MDALSIMDLVTSGGYHSNKLDGYMKMREHIAKHIGEANAPILQVAQLRELLLLAMKREIARQYKSNAVMAAVTALMYGMPVGTVFTTGAAEMAAKVNTHPGNDFGIKDLDALGTLFATFSQKNLNIIGNMFVYEAASFPNGTDGVVSLLRSFRATLTDTQLKNLGF